MIPTINRDMSIQSTIQGEAIPMEVGAGAAAKIASILIDMYSDPEGAVIREYSTNANDSHVAAGQKRPIEVTLPSSLAPFFRVKDYGLGLSVTEVRDVYSKYGVSTKDTSNDFNGMLGLGSKSALTYTSQFTIIATKDGRKVTVSVSRDNSGVGRMTPVSEVMTDDGNGVEVVIPVAYSQSFIDKANKFYSFWKPGTVLVNGKEPSRIMGNEVAPNIYSVRGLRGDYIVQGNVAYPVQDGLYTDNYYKDFSVVAYVPNGTVAFAPNREALMYDSTTKAAVQAIRDEFAAGLVASIQSDIDMAANALDALGRWHVWKQMFNYNMPAGIKYKGHALGERFDGYFMTFEPNAYRNQTQGRRNLGYAEVFDAVIVTDWTGDRPNTTQRNKMKVWAEENSLDPNKFILVGKKFGQPFTDNVETVSWDDVTKVKINKNPAARGGARGKVAWKVYNGSYFVDNNDPQPTSDVLYLSPSEKIQDALLDALLSYDADLTIVQLGSNRWDKFLREFPQAQHVTAYATALAKTYTDLLTEDDKVQMSMGGSLRRTLKSFEADRIDDPAVVASINLAHGTTNTPGIRHYTLMRRIGNLCGHYTAEVSVVVDNPLEVYPLVNTDSYYGVKVIDHTYIYMNAAYAADK